MTDWAEEQWILQEKYGGKKTPEYEKDLERLKEGEPVDYIIGFKDFLGCRIGLSHRPLIPRPETEHWVKSAIQEIQDRRVRVLDLFAGSGCVGIAVLKHCPNASADFGERNQDALSQIEKNALANGVPPDRFSIIQTDLFSRIRESYDFILANPPYIAAGSEDVQESVKQWEPADAVFAGPDGLAAIRPFLKEAKAYLNQGGRIFLEFDSPQKEAIEDILKEAGYEDWILQKDQFGQDRFFVIS